MSIYFVPVAGAHGFAIIDAEDYEKVSGYEWRLEYGGTKGKRCYVGCRISDKTTGQKCFRLAHVVLGLENSEQGNRVKYLNNNTFDCRKSNLECSEIAPKVKCSLIKYYDKRRNVTPWIVSAYLKPARKCFTVGSYKTEIGANEVIEFIRQNFTIETKEELDRAKPIIREWALDHEFTNPPAFYCGPKPVYSIGDERLTEGCVEVKTSKGWEWKHHLVWKSHGKRIPKGYKIFFKDGNKQNFEFSNLELVSPEESGRRLALNNVPEEFRGIVDTVWQINKTARDILSKPTQTFRVGDKLVKVALEDIQKVSGYDWRILNSQGKQVVGFRKKAADSKYKIITLAHVIFDAEDEKIRVKFKNGNRLDYRRKNLDVVFFDRRDVIKPPSFYSTFVKNRKGSKSNWKIDVFIFNKRAALGYYLTEESAKAVIKFAKTLPPPTDWEAFLQFRQDVRAWAIENGHATKSFAARGRELRAETGFNFFVRFCNRKTASAPPWLFTMRNPSVSAKKEYRFTFFKTEAAANEAIEFINNCGLPLTTREEADQIRELVLTWALAKGYINPPMKRQSSKASKFSFNPIEKGELICQTIKTLQ